LRIHIRHKNRGNEYLNFKQAPEQYPLSFAVSFNWRKIIAAAPDYAEGLEGASCPPHKNRGKGYLYFKQAPEQYPLSIAVSFN